VNESLPDASRSIALRSSSADSVLDRRSDWPGPQAHGRRKAPVGLFGRKTNEINVVFDFGAQERAEKK
jgi:hypothetical protein